MSTCECRRLWSPEEGIECPGAGVKYSGSEPPDVGAGNSSLGSLKEQKMLVIASSSLHSLIFLFVCLTLPLSVFCPYLFFLNGFVHYITLRLFQLGEQDRHAGALRMAQWQQVMFATKSKDPRISEKRFGPSDPGKEVTPTNLPVISHTHSHWHTK